MPIIDILIPVHNRPDILHQALICLAKQVMPDNWEVNCVVANDGSSSAIVQVVEGAVAAAPSWQHIQHLPLAKGGVAAARNQALAASHAPLVFFAAGDILFRPNVIAQHISFHGHNPEVNLAALGAVKWDPRCQPTAFMEWMVHGGSQNDFDAILGSRWVDPARYFFASHLSLKRSILPSKPFSEDFIGYGWEDLDVGHQLVKKGLKLYFMPEAIGLHYHHYSVEDIYERQLAVGKNFPIFQQRHKLPDAPRLNQKRKTRLLVFTYSGASWLLYQFLKKASVTHLFPYIFTKATASQFWKGVWKQEREKALKKATK